MAKINHHNFNDTIQDLLTEAKSKGVIQLKYESESWEGSTMLVGEQEMKNFGTCGYLGLELHPKIIEKSIDFTRKYGTQFSVSRTYLTSRKSVYLEELLSEMFQQKKVIAFTSTTMLHTSVLPCVVSSKDLLILDQQCHASIQTASQLVSSKGVSIDMIRHSNLEMLEYKIKQLKDKHERIWYMIDGVYSMFGDVAPIKELNELMKKYPQLHLYVDDAHGMSWYGKNGSGRIFKECVENERTIYITTMAKGYGVMGGIAVFPSNYWYEKVIIYGGALTHSHPIPPPMLGASIASAKIHLSDEIYDLQSKLQEKLTYANDLFKETDLPLISNPQTPIFFLGTGQPSVGYKMNKRILDEGFYVNIGMFPAVPIKNTGLRFTITNHNSKEDIKALVEALTHHYPLALEEDYKTKNDVRKAFHLPLLKEKTKSKGTDELVLEYTQSIQEIDSLLWNKYFESKGNFDYDSMVLLEKSYNSNYLVEDNWKFHYFIIKDSLGQVILATFFTETLLKDDLFSQPGVSLLIERERQKDRYFLCSKTMMMGSLISEGDHLFLDKTKPEWKTALTKLLKKVFKLQETNKVNTLILRDFLDEENELFSLFHSLGFFKMQLPNSNVLFDLQKDLDEPFIETLSTRSRKNIRQEVLRFEDEVAFDVKNSLTRSELDFLYNAYLQVATKNLDINIFPYPKAFFEAINEDPNWNFGVLLEKESSRLLGVICSFFKGENYFPLIIGIDYDTNKLYNSYKHIVYNITLYARKNGFNQVHFGFSSDTEKKKMGAIQLKKVGFLYIKDLYNRELIENKFRL